MQLRTSLCTGLVVCVAALTCSGAAHAGLVSIEGGFTQYIGPVEQPSALGYQSTFARWGYALPASPTEAIPGFDYAYTRGIGQGYVGLRGAFAAPAATVDFYRDRAVDPPLHNSVAFAPAASADVVVGEVFKVGTFTLSNGDWLGGFPDGRFLFELRTVSSTPELDQHVFTGSLNFRVTTGCSPDETTCSTDPDANADYFYLDGYPGFGWVGVYESAFLPVDGLTTGSIDLYAKIGSLIPVRFDNPQGVTLLAEIPQVQNLPAVPEPSSFILCLGGIAALSWACRRRVRTCSVVTALIAAVLVLPDTASSAVPPLYAPGTESLVLSACSGTNPAPPWNHSCASYLSDQKTGLHHVGLSGSETAQSSLTGANAFDTFASVVASYDPGSRVLRGYLSALANSPGAPHIGSLYATPSSTMELNFADGILVQTGLSEGSSLLIRYRVPIVDASIGKGGIFDYSFDYSVAFAGKLAYTYFATGNSASQSLSKTEGSVIDVVAKSGEYVNMSINLVSKVTAYGSNFGSANPPVDVDSSIVLDFANTIEWGGIDSIYNADTGELVEDWTLTSMGGVRWDLPSPVPEPPATLLLALGGVAIALRKARSRR